MGFFLLGVVLSFSSMFIYYTRVFSSIWDDTEVISKTKKPFIQRKDLRGLAQNETYWGIIRNRATIYSLLFLKLIYIDYILRLLGTIGFFFPPKHLCNNSKSDTRFIGCQGMSYVLWKCYGNSFRKIWKGCLEKTVLKPNVGTIAV